MRFVDNFEMTKAFLRKKTNPEIIKLKVNKFHYLKIKCSTCKNIINTLKR